MLIALPKPLYTYAYLRRFVVYQTFLQLPFALLSRQLMWDKSRVAYYKLDLEMFIRESFHHGNCNGREVRRDLYDVASYMLTPSNHNSWPY